MSAFFLRLPLYVGLVGLTARGKVAGCGTRRELEGAGVGDGGRYFEVRKTGAEVMAAPDSTRDGKGALVLFCEGRG